MKLNKAYLLIMALLASPAYALPIPEFTSAFLGLGEILLLMVAGLTLYFPFLKRFNKTNKFIYLALLISVLFNIYYFTSDFNKDKSNDREDRAGMIWDQKVRDNDPHAIDEKEAYKILTKQKSDKQDYVFVDARSRSETELGTAQGFLKMRWPDLMANYDLKGKKVILTCWTGMRGSEICDILRALGVDCQYLKGGLKGWMEAGLPVALEKNVTTTEFGTSEPYPNSSTLLSARETVKAVQEGAKIIDVRNTNAFKQKAIAGSINIVSSQLRTPDLEYQIDSLTAQKLVVACYGMFSCSEASALGWEMHRMGYQYLGAYSGGIDAFNALQDPKKIDSYVLIHNFIVSIFQKITLKIPIDFLILFSSLVLGCILYITKNMSIKYFITFKERQINRQELKTFFKSDDIAVSREIHLNYKKDLKNIFISFTVLGLALIYGFFIDIIYSAWGRETIFGLNKWQNNVGISFLSIILASAISVSLNIMIFKQISKKLCISIVVGFLMVLFAIQGISKISALVFIFTFLVMYSIQSLVYLNKLYHNYKIKNNYQNGYLSLSEAEYLIPEGTKAYHLSYLKNKGFQVPDGFIVKQKFNNKEFILGKLGKIFSVRSSALNEDQKDSSHAGLNLSVVPSKPESFLNDIKKVFESYQSDKEEIVLLQKYIDPLYSGAIFSKHPSWGGVIVLEWGEGLADKRMEGSENSSQIVMERVNGKIVFASKQNKIMFEHARSIYKLLMEVENVYNYSVDIEWAIDKDGLWLLQARPQSALNNFNYDLLDLEKEKLLTPHFKTLNTCELSLSMNNCTRLSASLVCHLWETSCSADEASRMALWKWKTFSHQQNAYIYSFGRIWNSDTATLTKPDKISWFMAKKTFNGNLKQINNEAKVLLQNNRINLAINWNELDKNDWLNLWNISLDNWKKMQTFAFYFEFMAQMATDDVLNDLAKLNLKGEDFISNGKDSFKDDISYRSENDYELSLPRYTELGITTQKILFGRQNIASKSLASFNDKTKKKIELARHLIYLREEYKHHSITMIYALRLAVLSLQTRFYLKEEVFVFDFNEIDKMFEQNFRSELKKRLSYRKKVNNYILPGKLNAKDVALLGKTQTIEQTNHLQGTFVSNSCEVQGHLLRIKDNSSLSDIKNILETQGDNSIVYAKFISPQLVNLASQYKVKALCSLYGSILSHPAVLAREANLPFIININLNNKWLEGKNIYITASGEIRES